MHSLSVLVRVYMMLSLHFSLLSQIFEDGPTTRGKLKTKTHTLFKQHYKKIIKPIINRGHNSDELIEIVRSGVKELLKDSQFLRGGYDENVSLFPFL